MENLQDYWVTGEWNTSWHNRNNIPNPDRSYASKGLVKKKRSERTTGLHFETGNYKQMTQETTNTRIPARVLPWLFHIACRVSTDIYPDCTRYKSSSPIVYRYIDPESTLLLLRRAVLNQTGGTGDGCSSSKPTLLGSDRPPAGAACLAMVQGIYPTRSRLWWSVFRLYLWEYR